MHAIPYTFGFYITDEGTIKTDEKHSRYWLEGDQLTIELINFTKLTQSVTFFKLFCLYKPHFGSIGEFVFLFSNIQFVPAHKRFRAPDNMLMTFTIPLRDEEHDLRIIPVFTRYAINSDGTQVLDRVTGLYLEMSPDISGYITVDVFDPLANKSRRVVLHRLVAFAWCQNPCWLTKDVVNHIDAIRTNADYRNLEWVTVQENNKHSVASGNVPTAVPCDVLNISTREVRSFPSISEAGNFIGVSRAAALYALSRKFKYAIKGLYEIKETSNPREWFNCVDGQGSKRSFTTIRVEYPDKNVKMYNHIDEFRHAYCIWNTSGVRGTISKFKEKFPELLVSYDRFAGIQRQVESYNLNTQEYKVYASLLEASNSTMVNRAIITKYCLHPNSQKPSKNGYVFRFHSDDVWDVTQFKPRKDVRYVATCLETNGATIFLSTRSIAKHFGVDRSAIAHKVKTGMLLKGKWKIEQPGYPVMGNCFTPN